jgi:hypothetical protein
MTQLPTAAIVGAAASAIAAATAPDERGVASGCSAASHRVGGDWVFGNRTGMSSRAIAA